MVERYGGEITWCDNTLEARETALADVAARTGAIEIHPFNDAGVIAGAGNVVLFLPQIALLFLAIGLLEDTGYLARAAFLIDRLMARVGLHGRAFVPLLSGYACAIPAILSTRTITSRKDRIVTILRENGVDIARRTVAKYRESMHIPSSVQRRREKTLQQACSEVGVNVTHNVRIEGLEGLNAYDMIVGADGANSVVRRLLGDAFGTGAGFAVCIGTESVTTTLTGEASSSESPGCWAADEAADAIMNASAHGSNLFIAR